jgi:hypothetical protein
MVAAAALFLAATPSCGSVQPPGVRSTACPAHSETSPGSLSSTLVRDLHTEVQGHGDQNLGLDLFLAGPAAGTFYLVVGSFDSHSGWSHESAFTVKQDGSLSAVPVARPSRRTMAAPDGNGVWNLDRSGAVNGPMTLSATTVAFVDSQNGIHDVVLPSGPQLSAGGPNPANIESIAAGCNQTIWLAIADNSGNSHLYWFGAPSSFRAVPVALPDDGAVQHHGLQSLSIAVAGDHLCYYRHFDSQAQGYTNYFGCIAPDGAIKEKPDTWESPSVALVTGPDGNAWGINHASGTTGTATILRIDSNADSSQFNLPGFNGQMGLSELVSADGYFWWCDDSLKLWKMSVH